MDFIKSSNGTVCHIGTKGGNGYGNRPNLHCGQYMDSWNAMTVKPGDSEYPQDIKDVCKTCQKTENGKEFLVGIKYAEPPKMVETKVVVDLNIPKKLTIHDAQEFVSRLEDVIEAHTGFADVLEFNVNFGK